MKIKDQARAMDAAIQMVGAKCDSDLSRKLRVNRSDIYLFRCGRKGIGKSFLYQLAYFTDLRMSEIERRLNEGC